MKAYEMKLNAMYDELVPASGMAATVAGEMVRAMCRISYRYYNDGDHIGVDYGNETCNAAARYLMEASDHELDPFINNAWGWSQAEYYEQCLDALGDATVAYLEAHPELREVQNTTDMYDCCRPEDQDWEDEYYGEEW